MRYPPKSGCVSYFIFTVAAREVLPVHSFPSLWFCQSPLPPPPLSKQTRRDHYITLFLLYYCGCVVVFSFMRGFVQENIGAALHPPPIPNATFAPPPFSSPLSSPSQRSRFLKYTNIYISIYIRATRPPSLASSVSNLPSTLPLTLYQQRKEHPPKKKMQQDQSTHYLLLFSAQETLRFIFSRAPRKIAPFFTLRPPLPPIHLRHRCLRFLPLEKQMHLWRT